jgi:hypothetical protein
MLRRRRNWPWIVAIALAWPTQVGAADEPIPFDLAGQKSLSETVDPGKYEVVASNRRATIRYSWTITRRATSIPSFEKPQQLPIVGPQSASGKKATCDHVRDSLKTTAALAKTEQDVSDVLDRAGATLGTRCSGPEMAGTLIDLKEYTTLHIPAIRIAAGEEVTISISRDSTKADKAPTTWTLHLETKPRGTWLTTYGPSVIPDRDEKFWLRPTSAANEFTVARQRRGKNELKVLPSLFFTWLPARNELRGWSSGPTGGLAVGDDTFAAFVGASLLYNWNLQFSAGASVLRVQRLVGKYSVGDTLKENLTDDQLHRYTGWLGWYGAVTFRFGESPYDSKKKSGESGESGSEDKKAKQ